MPNARIGGGGGNERNVGQTVFVAGLGQRSSLLQGKIHHNEHVGTMLLGLLPHFVNPKLEEEVVVPHEDHGDGEPQCLRVGDHLEALVHVGGSGLDDSLVCLLDGRAVGLGFSVGDAELNDGGTAFLHGHEDDGGVCKRTREMMVGQVLWRLREEAICVARWMEATCGGVQRAPAQDHIVGINDTTVGL